MSARWTACGALLGALAVACGAFGAHGLEQRASAEELEIWKTAALYHALHALALVLYGLFRAQRPGHDWPGKAFLAGTLVFSGTLYALGLGGPRWLGAVTPVGGVLLIGAWLGFAWQAWATRKRL